MKGYNIKNLILIVFVVLALKTTAQMQHMFKEDLEQEMRYKIPIYDGEDRGLALFQQDFQELLRQSSAFTNEETVSGTALMFIRYTPEDGFVLQNTYSSFGGDPDLLQEKREEIKRIAKMLLPSWLPAVYQGEPVYRSYTVSVGIASKTGQPVDVSVEGHRIRPTTENTRLGLHCFQRYDWGKDEKMLKYLFTASEIMPLYKSGIQGLVHDLNRLLDTASFVSKTRVQDSCTIDFITNRRGQFGQLDTYQTQSEGEELILDRLKYLSCNWNPAISGGRPLNSINRYRFIYSYDPEKALKGSSPFQLKIEKIIVLRAERLVRSDL